jgi:hypothetical protein
VTARKRAAYVQQARQLMRASHTERKVPIRKLARFAGSITSTMRAFLPGLALLRSTQQLIASAADVARL